MSSASILVRMYKKLLGDCFLLTFGDPEAPRAQRTHVLIDCGVLQNVPQEAKLIQSVAQDIASATEGRLDLLVLTHEHWDHISGFAHARQLLIDGMVIDELWLAWTEKRGDQQADAFREKLRAAKTVVERAAFRAAGSSALAIANLQDFNGPMQSKPGRLSAPEIIPALITRAEATGVVRYLEPGEMRQTPGPQTVRAYVLGPPRNPERLLKSNPSKGSDKETYLVALNERYAAATPLSEALQEDGPRPFAERFAIGANDVSQAADGERSWFRERYFGEDQAWRNIDNAWLGAAGSLALKLDHDTNNNSLALAFKREPGGSVMLFAGDSQGGNWLSWHDQDYQADGPGGDAIKAAELLARTVLYKVGHHASHNATLRERGLALMTRPDLVAMIPVVEAEARRIKNGRAVHRGWNMPYPDLLAQLIEKTDGRVLRGDAEPGRGPGGERLSNDPGFLDRVRSSDLYVEYALP